MIDQEKIRKIYLQIVDFLTKNESTQDECFHIIISLFLQLLLQNKISTRRVKEILDEINEIFKKEMKEFNLDDW